MRPIIKAGSLIVAWTVFLATCVSAGSWVSAYALSSVEYGVRAQQASFGYYQDIISTYTQHSALAILLLSVVATWWGMRPKN